MFSRRGFGYNPYAQAHGYPEDMFSQLFSQPQPRYYQQPFNYYEPEYEDMDDDDYGFPQQQHAVKPKQRVLDPRRYSKPTARPEPPKQQRTFIPVRNADQPEIASIPKKPAATTPSMDKERAAELIQARALGHAIRKSNVLKRLRQLKELRAKVDALREQYEHKFFDGTASEQDALVYSECLTRELITLDTFDSKYIRPHRRAAALYIEKLMQVVDQWKMLDNKAAGVAKPEGMLLVDSPVTSDASLDADLDLDQDALDCGLSDSESDNETDAEVKSPKQVEGAAHKLNDPSSGDGAHIETTGETISHDEPMQAEEKAAPVLGSSGRLDLQEEPPAEPMQTVDNTTQDFESPLSVEVKETKVQSTEPVSVGSETTTEPVEPGYKNEQTPLAAHFFPAQQTKARGNQLGDGQVKKVYPGRREADDEGYTEKLLKRIHGDADDFGFLPMNFMVNPRYSYYRPGFTW